MDVQGLRRSLPWALVVDTSYDLVEAPLSDVCMLLKQTTGKRRSFDVVNSFSVLLSGGGHSPSLLSFLSSSHTYASSLSHVYSLSSSAAPPLSLLRLNFGQKIPMDNYA